MRGERRERKEGECEGGGGDVRGGRRGRHEGQREEGNTTGWEMETWGECMGRKKREHKSRGAGLQGGGREGSVRWREG